MLLQIVNPSVSIMSYCTGCTVQWSDTIPSWNVWLLVRIHLTWFHFNTPTQPNYSWWSNFGPKFPHFDDWQGLGEQISWVFFSSDVDGSTILFYTVPLYCQMSICLVQCLTAGFTVRNIIACCPVLASSIYSASPTESATGLLTLWCPRDCTICHQEDMPWCGVMIIFVLAPIQVWVSN